MAGGFRDDALISGAILIQDDPTDELIIPMESGVITEDDVQGDLFQLSRGRREGRGGDDEITIFKNGGGGHLDLMTALHAVERAKEEGIL